jgi:hypothetical protein
MISQYDVEIDQDGNGATLAIKPDSKGVSDMSDYMLFVISYTVLANGWTNTKTIRAIDEADALATFVEVWERDGSSIDELSSYYVETACLIA